MGNIFSDIRIPFMDNIIDLLNQWGNAATTTATSNVTNYINAMKSGNDGDGETSPEGFLTKIQEWTKDVGKTFISSLMILYIPICWFLITRKGYNVGGDDINGYPYRDPNQNVKSYGKVNEIFKQAGGKGRSKTQSGGGFTGPYTKVEPPYTLLNSDSTGIFTLFTFWLIESMAATFSFLRAGLQGILSSFRNITGYDPNSNYNTYKFMFSIPISFMIIPFLTVFAFIIPLVLNILVFVLKIKDYWFPFVGTRLFSPVVWILIFLFTGLFVPYGTLILLLAFSFAMLYASLQWMGFSIFTFAAPLLFIGRKLSMNQMGEITKMFKATLNGFFWIFMWFVLTGPTRKHFKDPAMYGGMAYLIYLFATTQGKVF
jgi:hypothetical protein